MPHCIYCGKVAPSADFDNEHVISRAISGQGTNWTLVDRVCGRCNKRFSKYEAHMFQQSVEALARAFNGPIGRGKSVNGYSQPMKLNHLYMVEIGDPLMYEGGLSLPGNFYLRPQLIEKLDGTCAALVTNRSDIPLFERALSDIFSQKVDGLTLERQGRDFIVAPLEYKGSSLVYKPDEVRSEPTNTWLRDFPDSSRVPTGKKPTARFSMREDGTAFVRATDKLTALNFMNTVLNQGQSCESTQRPQANVGTQEFHLLHTIEIAKVQATVLKTGLNLVCYLYGEQVAQNSAFDHLRALVLADPLDSAALNSVCMQTIDTSRVPLAPTGESQHRFMIDTVGSNVLLRMRLYNHMCYTAILSNAALTLGAPLNPQRVVLDYQAGGLRSVPVWP